jgi:hypothetical protein
VIFLISATAVIYIYRKLYGAVIPVRHTES